MMICNYCKPFTDTADIPTSGKNLIIIALVNNVLHFRIFDASGKLVESTDEKSLTGRETAGSRVSETDSGAFGTIRILAQATEVGLLGKSHRSSVSHTKISSGQSSKRLVISLG